MIDPGARGALGGVLVATDFSEGAHIALERAARLPLALGAGIELLHAVPEQLDTSAAERMAAEAKGLMEGSRQAAMRALEKAKTDVRWNVVLRTGDARQVILEEARTRNSDLIVLGTKGRTGLAYVLVGSVAEGVLRAASCDVLVARLPRANFNLS
jgi:nucleotide-binding universal stress UspA family protein